MAVAVFNYAAWIARFPVFTGKISEASANALFADAGVLYLDNTDQSPVADAARRLILLNLLVAHLAVLDGVLEQDGAPTGLVGRVKRAQEGSVSVEVETPALPGTAAWYGLTNYGLQFWQATKGLRSATYVAPPPYSFEPVRGFGWRR